MNSKIIEDKIKEHLPDATIKVQDLTGGGDHWKVQVTSSFFKDKSLIEQHQLIYKSLSEYMNKEIHALAIDTKAK